MPGYIKKTLLLFGKKSDIYRPCHTPHPYTPPSYGKKVQIAVQESTAPILPPADITEIQQVVGRVLYYGRAIDNNLLMSLNTVASQQSKATEHTKMLVEHLLKYCPTYPNAVLTYHASDMLLHIHTDASFLSEPGAKSRAGGFFFLTSKTENIHHAPLNAPIHVLCQILKMFLLQSAKLNIVHFSKMPKWEPLSGQPSKNSATHNHRHQLEPTTLPPPAL